MLDLLGIYVYLACCLWSLPKRDWPSAFFCPAIPFWWFPGLFAALPDKLNIALVMLAFFLGSVIGDSTGYWTGRVMGKTLFNREVSRIFKPSRVAKAHAFFEKYGVKTVILARFVPIVRTFAPLVVGAAEMPYSRFCRSASSAGCCGSRAWSSPAISSAA